MLDTAHSPIVIAEETDEQIVSGCSTIEEQPLCNAENYVLEAFTDEQWITAVFLLQTLQGIWDAPAAALVYH